MERPLRAFLTYNPADTVVTTKPNGEPDFGFVFKIRDALQKAGFPEVFIENDENAAQAGENRDNRIFAAIAGCDVFVALIGKNWLHVDEGLRSEESDRVVREIRSAAYQGKELVSILTDGAAFGLTTRLPPDVHILQNFASLSIARDDAVDEIVGKLHRISQRLTQSRKLGSAWMRGYFIVSVLAYYFSSVHTHVLGIGEFGVQVWLGMAQVWSGFYIWPIFFLPFILLALYRPLTLLIELTINARSIKDAFSYGSPLIFGTLVALLAASIEIISTYQVPWSINPLLPQPGCQRGPSSAAPDLANLSSFDPNGHLELLLQERPFWLSDKCWPNAFFYLTVPVYRNKVDLKYETERLSIQKSFVRVLRSDFKIAPYSASFTAYVISFTILIWIAAVGITMAIFYVTVRIRRADNTIVKGPSQSAYLCLTYAFLAFMVWVPFRMNTIYFKQIYFCSELSSCALTIDHYLYDIILGTMLLIAYAYLTVGLLVQYRRTATSVLAATALVVIGLSAFAVVRFGENIAMLTEHWQFYVAIAIPTIVLLAALWWQFDPSVIELNDFMKTVEYGQPDKLGSPPVRFAWASGLFYLLVFASVAGLLGFIAGSIPIYSLIVIVIGCVVLIPLIGALQLRHDGKISEGSFVELAKAALSNLKSLASFRKGVDSMTEGAVMRILFLAANPSQTSPLDLEDELRGLEQELRMVKFRDSIVLIARHAVRPDDLLRHVRADKPNVIHFSGHGSNAGIILRADNGGFHEVDGLSLKRFLDGRGIDLVVLNACYSKGQGEKIGEVVKAVVGTTDAVDDEAARRFTVAFYRSLGEGLSIREAFRDGGDAVALHGFPDVFHSSGEMNYTLVRP
jgi:hypothetical protein